VPVVVVGLLLPKLHLSPESHVSEQMGVNYRTPG